MDKPKIFIPLILTVLILTYFVMYYLSNTDVKNVSIEGYVYDQDDKQPLSGVRVIINSDRFEDDNGNKNYDEYLGHDEIKLYTNQDGYYSTLVNKSAFIWIDFKKEGYANKTEKGSHSQKKMSYEAYLNKHH